MKAGHGIVLGQDGEHGCVLIRQVVRAGSGGLAQPGRQYLVGEHGPHGVSEPPRVAERAALALTEAATRLSDRPGAVTDEIWAEAARHYDERQLEALVLMVAITNFFNRLNTTFRVPAGTRWD